jgi:hypothetical protein
MIGLLEQSSQKIAADHRAEKQSRISETKENKERKETIEATICGVA